MQASNLDRCENIAFNHTCIKRRLKTISLIKGEASAPVKKQKTAQS